MPSASKSRRLQLLTTPPRLTRRGLRGLKYNEKENDLDKQSLNTLEEAIKILAENSPKSFLIPNQNGNTPIHYLAKRGNFNKIPSQIYQENPELLLRKNKKGNNALHEAFEAGEVGNISLDLFTQKNLDSINKQGTTLFEKILKEHDISRVPLKFRTFKNLIQNKNLEGDSCLDYIFTQTDQLALVPIHVLAQYKPTTLEKEERLHAAFKKFPSLVKNIKNFKQRKKFAKFERTLGENPQIT